jgi:Ca2+-binding RTX toxin-like protein
MPTKHMVPYRNIEGSATWVLTNNRAALWAPGATITYTFDANLDAQERAFIRAAMDTWQEIASIQFVEQAGGHVRIAFDPTIPFDPTGFVGGRTNGLGPAATTLVLNQQAYDGYLNLTGVGYSGRTTSAFETTIHELGHILGFGHAGPYNGASASINDAVYYEDTSGYTVMSYWAPDGPATQPWTDVDFDFGADPSTPQALDLLVAQFVYGANLATRTGDDTYFYNSTLAASSPLSFETYGANFAGALWDAGGYDTIDLSDAFSAQRVDLRDPNPGAGPLHDRLLVEDIGTFNDILGFKGNLFIPATVQIERVIGGYGKDTFIARDGVNTTLEGRGGADILTGGSGDDKLFAGADDYQDKLFGGGGSDHYMIFGGDTVVDTSGGSEVVIGQGLQGSVTSVDLWNADDTVSVFGLVKVDANLRAGFDTYEGGDGSDVVRLVVGATTAGKGDMITLGDGVDTVTASLDGSGWGAGQDVFDGGDGEDTFIGKFVVDISVTDLSTGITSLPGLDDHLSISNFEHVSFAGARAIIAAWGAPVLTSNAIATSALGDEVAINFDSNFTVVDTGDGNDIVDGDIARLSDHDMTSTLDRIVTLGGGNDLYVAGAMSLGTHKYDGGTGSDTLDVSRLDEIEWQQDFLYYRSAADKIVEIDAVKGTLTGHFQTFEGSYDFAAEISGFEDYVLELGGTLRFDGDPLAATRVTLTGSGYADAQVNLGSGDDTVAFLDFRPDADQPIVVKAGQGRDVLDLSGLVPVPASFPAFATEDVTVDRQSGLFSRYIDALSSRTVSVAIDGFEVFYLPDFLVGGVDDGRTVISRFIGIDGVDEVHGGVRDDLIEGFGGADILFGGAGADRLYGGGGIDKMAGGIGNDIYTVDNASDVVIEGLDEGTADSVSASVSYALGAGVHVERLQTTKAAGTSAINLTGNAFAQTITGNAGANTLKDGGGAGDVLKGLGGDDLYLVYSAATTIVESSGQGTADRVMAAVDYALAAGVDIELLTTTSSTGTAPVSLTGNALRQEITGNAGANVLKDGGGAGDVLKGLGGNDIYLVYSSATTIVEGSTGGTADRIASAVDFVLGADVHVEIMTTTSAAGTSGVDLTGNALKQQITGNAGSNILRDGRGVGDVLSGLGGNDVYQVYSSATTVAESATGGTADRIMAAVDYVLGAGVHVETMTTNGSTGTSGIDLTGNEFVQAITGNAGSNIIDGKGGSDTLSGLAGKDFFVFSTALGAGNVDTITDFNVADDTIRLENAIFTALTVTGALSAAAFQANTTGLADDATDRIVYETDTGKLFYDADGNQAGGVDGVHFATLAVGLALTSGDFVVI